MSPDFKQISLFIIILSAICAGGFLIINTGYQQVVENTSYQQVVENTSYQQVVENTSYQQVVEKNITLVVPTPSSAIYLTDFGINGDGSDESGKLQAAFSYAEANGIKQIIFPPEKTIGVNAAITTGHNQELVGNGCTIKLVDSSTINHQAEFFRVHEGCYVHNLKFDGNMDNQSYAYGSWNGRPSSTNGVFLYSGVRFENNEVFNVGAYSVTAYQQSNIIFKNNIIHDTRQYGVALKSDGMLCNNVQIVDNSFYNCYQTAIKLAGASNSLISGNSIIIPEKMPGNDDPEGITLYSLDYRNSGMTITNNTITGHGGSSKGIRSQTSDNALTKITNNQISNVSKGIIIRFNNGIVTGNTISGCRQCIENHGNGNTVDNNICEEDEPFFFNI